MVRARSSTRRPSDARAASRPARRRRRDHVGRRGPSLAPVARSRPSVRPAETTARPEATAGTEACRVAPVSRACSTVSPTWPPADRRTPPRDHRRVEAPPPAAAVTATLGLAVPCGPARPGCDVADGIDVGRRPPSGPTTTRPSPSSVTPACLETERVGVAHPSDGTMTAPSLHRCRRSGAPAQQGVLRRSAIGRRASPAGLRRRGVALRPRTWSRGGSSPPRTERPFQGPGEAGRHPGRSWSASSTMVTSAASLA